MFAPSLAKAQRKEAVSSTTKLAPQCSTRVERPLGGAVDRVRVLQWSISNQAAVGLLAQRATNLTGNELHDHNRHQTDEASLNIREATPGGAWYFSQIPIFPPDRESPPEPRCSLGAPRLRDVLQPKLAVGVVDDPLEQEADRVADQVTRMSGPELSIAPVPAQVSRKCAACEEEERRQIQTQRAGAPVAAGIKAPSIVHEVLRSPGRPLGAPTRAFFEPRFGIDFSQVQVHTDARAAESAQAVNALAYTVGRDVAFASGRYRPTTPTGRELLAHELVHTLQQNSAASTIQRQTDKKGSNVAPAPGPASRPLTPAEQIAPKFDKSFDKANLKKDDVQSAVRLFGRTDVANEIVNWLAAHKIKVPAVFVAQRDDLPDDCEKEAGGCTRVLAPHDPQSGRAGKYEVYIVAGQLKTEFVPFQFGETIVGRAPDDMADTLFHELLHVWFMEKHASADIKTGHTGDVKPVIIDQFGRKTYGEREYDPVFLEKLKQFDTQVAPPKEKKPTP